MLTSSPSGTATIAMEAGGPPVRSSVLTAFSHRRGWCAEEHGGGLVLN